tara:strand:+ start:1023 stop:1244 length:222 start_codon:yes stop_codon:yes gene_type:complete
MYQVRKEIKMDYKAKYKLLLTDVKDIMTQLRELESEKDDSGNAKGWADINSYSVWWALFSATLAQVEDDSEKK